MSAYAGKAEISDTTGESQQESPLGFVRKFWAGFHNAVIISIIFTLLGTFVGIKASSQYYSDKLDEIVQTGAMLHKKKVFLVQPKL